MQNDHSLIRELLETIKSKHTEEILENYQDIEELFSAQLEKKYEKTKYGITLIHETLRRIFYDIACDSSFYEDPQHILYYMKFLLSNLDQERFYILHVNKKGYMTEGILHNIGSIDRVSIYPREVLKSFIYDKPPWGIIMVHNHPSGNPTPSKNDIIITQRLEKVLNVSEICLVEHIIVAKNGFTMMKRDGCL